MVMYVYGHIHACPRTSSGTVDPTEFTPHHSGILGSVFAASAFECSQISVQLYKNNRDVICRTVN